jgi:ATP-dependent Clp protease ATP-binding subunit ClpA
MFERFTDQARQVVVLAQEEARGLVHNYIGTEHILLGLLRINDNVVAQVLESLDVSLERTRSQVQQLVGAGEEATSGQIPFTPRAKKVLELALREALSLGHNYIGPEHILLGLARENDGVAARILLDFGADSKTIRNAVIRELSGSGGPPRAPETSAYWSSGPRGPIGAGWLDGLDQLLDRLAADIRRELGRDPDPGDLLLALACARETLAARALGELGVELDRLWGTIERVRKQDAGAREQLARQIQEASVAKDQAIEAGDFDDAARLRDQERELRQQARASTAIDPDVLNMIRTRLGIPRQSGDPPEASASG